MPRRSARAIGTSPSVPPPPNQTKSFLETTFLIMNSCSYVMCAGSDRTIVVFDQRVPDRPLHVLEHQRTKSGTSPQPYATSHARYPVLQLLFTNNSTPHPRSLPHYCNHHPQPLQEQQQQPVGHGCTINPWLYSLFVSLAQSLLKENSRLLSFACLTLQRVSSKERDGISCARGCGCLIYLRRASPYNPHGYQGCRAAYCGSRLNPNERISAVVPCAPLIRAISYPPGPQRPLACCRVILLAGITTPLIPVPTPRCLSANNKSTLDG